MTTPRIQEILWVAWQSQQHGRLDQAIVSYREVLRLEPAHPDALHMIGLIAYQQGRHGEAAELLGAASRSRPDSSDILSNWGLALQALGRFADALACFDSAIVLRPQFPEAHLNRGMALKALGRIDEALASYERAIVLKPELSAAHYNRGIALQSVRRLHDAEAAFRQAVVYRPRYPAALVNRGNVLRELGRFDEAEASYRAALALDPADADYLTNLGLVLQDQGRPIEALAALERAITARPGTAEAHSQRGLVLHALGRDAEAMSSLDRSIALREADASLRVNRGVVLLHHGCYDAATADFRAAVVLAPNLVPAHYNLGLALQATDRFADAAAAFAECLRLDPHHAGAASSVAHVRGRACDWSRAGEDITRVSALIDRDPVGILPFPLLALRGISALQQLRAARNYARSLLNPAPLSQAVSLATSVADGRLRVGYLSADLFDHATAHLIAGVLEHHDRSTHDVHMYSYGPDTGDPWRRRLENATEHFVDLRSLSDAAAARRITDDRVQILVDLKGYTQGYRIGITARRPAPVIVNWLGYPGSLGDPRLADYLIGDPVVTPLDHAGHFSETLALLPECYQPNDRRRAIAARPSREAAGLPSNGFVFCSFNQSYKIDREVFTLWGRLLQSVPGSILWLLRPAEVAEQHLRAAVEGLGIASDRLVFASHVPVAEHLARLQCADLALDTYPCTSHTTASDALWAGVPLVTRIGDTFASRVAASLLTTLGLPDLVTRSADQYFQKALFLAQHAEELAVVRLALYRRREDSPLFDTARFTRNLERLYEVIWAQTLAGEKRPITLTG